MENNSSEILKIIKDDKIKKKISELLKDTSDGSSITYDDQNNIFVSRVKNLIMKRQFQIFLLTIIILMMLPLNKKPFMKMSNFQIMMILKPMVI